MIEKNLIGAKVGDKVIVEKYQYGERYAKVDTIKYITKNGNFKIGDQIYYPTGKLRGDCWYARWSAYLATEEDIVGLRNMKFASSVLYRIKRLNTITYDQAMAISKIFRWEE